ncbi:MAG TPA: tetratricopeptide repeat protein [Planctomycetaceae bacterium]
MPGANRAVLGANLAVIVDLACVPATVRAGGFDRTARLRGCVLIVIALALPFSGSDLFARGGGQSWGYRPPAGPPLTNYWRFASPYGAIQGWGIPHHSLDAPRLGPGYSSGARFDNTRRSPVIDRRVEFPGASSNTTPLLPAFHHDIPVRPYSTEKKYDPPYYHNYDGYWHHGYWGGGQSGWGRWGGPAGIWSVARWWLGPLYFTSGYGTYRNPFAVVQNPVSAAYLNYAHPLEKIDDDEVPGSSTSTAEKVEKNAAANGAESPEEIRNYLVKTPEVKAGLTSFDAASEAFQKGHYEQALEHIDAALAQLPYDPALHEFRALVLFAMKDYQRAAATVYAVLSVSPGWDWTTLSGLYADQDVFTRQLRDLETFHKEHPESAAAAFLRGYHYTTCRHTEAAIKQFEATVKLLPDDRFLPQLLALVTGGREQPAPDRSSAPRESATDNSSEPAPSPTMTVNFTGDWRAQPRDSTVIDLRLFKDQRFVWTATQGGSPRVIAGRYALEGDTMFLAGGSGTLIGRVQVQTDGSFKFSLLGNPQSDPGLDFRRVAGP